MCRKAWQMCQFTTLRANSRTSLDPSRAPALWWPPCGSPPSPSSPSLLAAAPAHGAARPTAIVSIGDSFISGEGGRWLGNGSEPLGTRSGTDRAAYECGALGCEYDPARVYGASEANDCHRSDVAPIESAPIDVDAKVNLACSGAKARDLWPGAEGGTSHFGEPPQADQLAAVAARDKVRMVVVTVGANDVGFGELVAQCALDWARSPEDEPDTCHREAEEQIQGALPRATRDRTAALHGVRRTLRAAGYAAPTTGWWRWDTPRRSPRGAGSAIPRRAGAG